MGDHLPYRDDLFLNYKSINIKWIAALKRSPSPVSALSTRLIVGMPSALFQWGACAAFELAGLLHFGRTRPLVFLHGGFVSGLELQSVAGPGRAAPT
jgi:hypothetical protein